MAVDFSLLPPEQALPDQPPSKLIWTVVFFVLIALGMFAVLLLWPRSESTQSWTFWACLIGFPTSVALLIVLRRYSLHESHQLDVSLRNEAARAYREHVFAAASVSLALLDHAYRFSFDLKINTVAAVQSGAVTLASQHPLAPNAEPVKARWLDMPGFTKEETIDQTPSDTERHKAVLTRLFSELMGELAPSIRVLPVSLELTVECTISSQLATEEIQTLWRHCWHGQNLRPMHFAPASECVDLHALDAWFDQILSDSCLHARLIVAAQLHPVLSRAPAAQTSEAAVAILLAPHALAHRFGLARAGNLHRPVRSVCGMHEQCDEMIAHALQWANVPGTEIASVWQTGLDEEHANAVRRTAARHGLTASVVNLDLTVGQTGAAAPWLALGCAAAALRETTHAQCVVAGGTDHTDCMVLTPVSPTNFSI